MGCKFFICITKQDILNHINSKHISHPNLELFALERFPTDNIRGAVDGIFYTSSKTGYGVKQMFEYLAKYMEEISEEQTIFIEPETEERRCSGCSESIHDVTTSMRTSISLFKSKEEL